MPTAESTKKYVVNHLRLKTKADETPEIKNEHNGPADFETAITASGFGKYNFLLILISIPAAWASMFQTTTMSYVFPAAHCDLNLSLNDKGLLNAITYLGTISSALIWGFLYDTLGRKKLLMVGFLLDGIIVLISSFSQTKIMLMITKFLGGFIINGPFAAFTSYLSEFQCSKFRARSQLVMGAIFNFGSLFLPILALLIIPNEYNFEFFNIKMQSWNIYLLICCLPSLIAGTLFIFLPESPKFLMTVGRNKDALKVFQTVYQINTGKSAKTYPIKELVDEIKMKEELRICHGVTASRTKIQALREGFQQMKPLFFQPHLINLLLVILIQSFSTMSLNTTRLWLPQIFQAINDYQFYNNGSNADLCTMLEMVHPQGHLEKCVVNLNNIQVYENSMVVAGVTILGYVFAGSLINILGKKRLLVILGITSGSCAFGLYFTVNNTTTLITSSLTIAAGSICTNIMLAVIIDLFPTTLRTMTISLTMMIARMGAMSGNILFPIFLQIGCATPFFFNGSIIILCGILALLLPNTDLKALE